MGRQASKYTPLHFACDGSDKLFRTLDIVRELVKAKAKLDAKDSNGNTPLLMAAATGLLDVCKFLHQSGCDRNATNLKATAGTA